MINKVEQKVIKFIRKKNLIDKGDKILVALSGGADSVFLLRFLNKFKRKYHLELGAIHINHKLRGEEALKDEEFCRGLCANLNIEFFSFRKDIKNYAAKRKISLEEAGRDVRYSILKKTAAKNNFSKIATAHNCSDNAETVLLNLIKGTGIKGISGIPVFRENIIRPILILSKAEIVQYLKQYNFNFRIDKTNTDINYERNFIRRDVMPLIKQKLNPSIENTILNSSEVFKKISCLVDSRIEPFLKTIGFKDKENVMEIFPEKIKSLEKELLGDFLREGINRNFSIQLSFNDLEKLIFLISSKTGTKINLSENLSAVKEREKILIFFYKSSGSFIPIKISVNQSIKLNGYAMCIKDVSGENVKFSNNRNIEYISADKCSEVFILREWKEGEKFYPIGLKSLSRKAGSKKISDFLNEQKVPSFLKKKQLVLTCQNKIVWILGLRLDDRFKITNTTKKIYQICMK